MSYHWLHPGLEAGSSDPRKGRGVWTAEPIPAGTLLLVWGGKVVDREAFDRLPRARRCHSLQIDENLFLVSRQAPEPADLINHSCDPNAGMCGQIALEALLDLPAGVEVTYDYAMSDGSSYDEFECACGAATCRERITGDDWRRPELQERYARHFSPYLGRRIAAQRLESALSEAFAAT